MEGRDYRFLEALDQGMKLPRVSIFYTFGLLLVAIAMIALPVIYLALVGCAGYGVYHHAVHHYSPIMEWGGTSGGRAMIVKFLVYVTPLIIGGVIVFFMIKPIFARRARHAEPLALNPAAEPVLFAFIEGVCKAVRAPKPKKISIDCALNASAGFRRGFLSFLGSDLVLTIGMPLAGNLTVSQFAGVLAHEFGHFSQGLGMRLSYVIRSVNHWFARVVFERDSWDESLESAAMETEDWRAMLILNFSRLGVWFSRLILHGLMLVGHGISSFMLRQMEFDADLYEIRLSGSETFEATSRRMAVLGTALDDTYKDLRTNWKKTSTLADSLPAALLRDFEAMQPDRKERIDSTIGLRKTKAFDTHPCDADRIRAARRAQEAGIFHDDRPGSVLFENFDALAKQVTILHYAEDIGLPVHPSMLVPVSSRTAPEDSSDGAAIQIPAETETVSDRVFMGLIDLVLPLDSDAFADSPVSEEELIELEELESQLSALEPQLEPHLAEYESLRAEWISAHAVEMLKGIESQDNECFLSAECGRRLDELRQSLREVTGALGRRFELRVRQQKALIADEARTLRNEQLTDLRSMNEAFPKRQEIANAIAIGMQMIELNATGEFDHGAAAIRTHVARVQDLGGGMQSEVGGAEHSGSGLKLKIATLTMEKRVLEQLLEDSNAWMARLNESLEAMSIGDLRNS